MENINHPKHYQGNKFEAIDIIEDFNLNFCLGNAIKYILRAGKKGDKTEDIEKAIWYLNREIDKTKCPICGKSKYVPEDEVCLECSKEKEKGEAIKVAVNKVKPKCPICGKVKEIAEEEVCYDCHKKYFSNGNWHKGNELPKNLDSYLVCYKEYNILDNKYDNEVNYNIIEYVPKECTKEQDYGFWNIKAVIDVIKWKEIK